MQTSRDYRPEVTHDGCEIIAGDDMLSDRVAELNFTLSDD